MFVGAVLGQVHRSAPEALGKIYGSVRQAGGVPNAAPPLLWHAVLSHETTTATIIRQQFNVQGKPNSSTGGAEQRLHTYPFSGYQRQDPNVPVSIPVERSAGNT